MGEVKDNDAYEEELLDYEEEDEKAPDSVTAKATADSAKTGYVGIHSSGFRDFLLKPGLLRAIVDCGSEHPSEGMNQSQGTPALKRKRPELPPLAPSLTEHERTLYDIIRSKQNLGIWIREMKSQAKLSDNVVTKCLSALRNKNLIKDVVNYQNKAKKTVMAAEFEPSKEITGGSWYLDGSLDQDLITMLKALCVKLLNINKPGVVTVEGMTDLCNRTGAYQAELTRQQIEEILRALVLDNEIMQVKSNGMGEFTGIPTGKDCYKAIRKRGPGGKAKTPGALASIPCGVCPRISLCTPDGVISPTTCVYYNKWLDF